MCKYPIFIITISFITDIVAKYEIQCYNICVKKEKIMLIGFLFLIINIAFIIISIVKISKKQKITKNAHANLQSYYKILKKCIFMNIRKS